jgi:hypothetical protein
MTSTFRTNADGSLVCDHRDLSCCEACADHPEIVEVYGSHFLVTDPTERAELLAMMET